MNYKLLTGSLLTASVLLAACGNGEENKVNESNQTDSNVKQEKNNKNISKDSMSNEKYYKELTIYADSLYEIAKKYDDNTDNMDLVSKEYVSTLKKLSNEFDNASKKFKNNTKHSALDEPELVKILDSISQVYSMIYKEMAKNIEVGVKDNNYQDAALLAYSYTHAAHISALEQLTLQLEIYSKERLDSELNENTANNLNELVYTSSDDVLEAFNEMHKLSISALNIPEDANDKLITPGLTLEVYNAARMNNATKDVTMSEYNENVRKYNKEVHPLITMDNIDEPTTIDIGNNLIERMNSLVDVYSENDIPYGE